MLLSPLIPLVLYLGLSITTLHLEADFLVSNHFEFIVFTWTLLATFFYFVKNKQELSDFLNHSKLPFIFVTSLILTPAVASFFSTDYLMILNDGEYRTLVKMLCLCPLVFHFAKSSKYRETLTDAVLFFYTLFAFYFLYRFFVLHEAREFDLRPTLKIRHGDPNFLCLFFSVMVPLYFLRAQSYFLKLKYLRSLLLLSAGLLLAYCAFVTESRMGLISLFVGLVTLFLTSNARKTAKIFSLFFLCSLVAFFLTQGTELSNRFSEIKDKSSTDRILTYENGIKSFLASPVFGVGMHAAKNTYFENSKYPDFQSDSKRLEIHSTYLNILAELGSVGFLVFFSFIFWCFHSILNSKNKFKYFLLSSFVIALLSMLTIGVAYKDLVYLHLFLLAGLAQSLESYDHV